MATPIITVKTSFLKTIDIGLRGLLFSKFGDVLELETVKKGVIFHPKEIALREMAERRNRTELEFINVWRTSTAPDYKRMVTPVAQRGVLMEYADSETKEDIIRVKAMPVHLEYNVWFWTKDLDRLGLIAERYLFWQQDDPNLSLNFDMKYDLVDHSYPIDLDLHFGPLVDESTIKEKYDKGVIYCLNTPVTIDGYIFIADSVKTIKKITLTIYDKDNLNTRADIDEVIVEDSNQDVELEIALRLLTIEHECE